MFQEILAVSSLSLADQVTLIGHYLKDKNVKPTDVRIKSKGYSPEQLAQLEKHLAVKKADSHSALGVVIQNVERFEFPNYYSYFQAFVAYDNHGILPFSGGYFEQPGQLMDIFDVFKSIQLEEDAKRQKELEQKSKVKSKR